MDYDGTVIVVSHDRYIIYLAVVYIHDVGADVV